MIVAGRIYGGAHYAKAGGGKYRGSICGTVGGPARSWKLGTNGERMCRVCAEIAERKYGVKAATR